MVLSVHCKIFSKLQKFHTVGHDILQPIADHDLYKLREYYKDVHPSALLIYNYLTSVIKWKKQEPNTKYLNVYAPYGNIKDGTFISTYECGRSEIYLHTLEDGSKTLYEALVRTKLINWRRSWVFHAVSRRLWPVVSDALKTTAFQPSLTNFYDIWWMPKETARDFKIVCEENISIQPLKSAHAKIVNAAWSARNKETESYWAKLIEMKGGYGIFLKSNGQLVSCIVRNLYGRASLQTLDQYKKRGYGSLLVKHLSYVIAEGGQDPLSVVMASNTIQVNLLKKLGFEVVGDTFFMYNKEYTATLGA